MKTVTILIALAMGLVLGGCAEQPLVTDEESQKKGPAAYSPDPTGYLPRVTSRPGWGE